MHVDEARLSGYNFCLTYKGIEYEISTDVCFEVMLYDGSIEPKPEDHGHTWMEISDFFDQTMLNGEVIGLD